MCVVLQEVRWSEHGFGMLGMVGKRGRLWWTGKGDIVGGLGVMVKEEFFMQLLCLNVLSSNFLHTIF